MSNISAQAENASALEDNSIKDQPNVHSTETIHEMVELPKGVGQATLDLLMDVSLQLAVELGRSRMSVRQVLELQKGSVVELDRLAGDPVDVYVNDHLIAHGEVVVVDDKFGVRINDLVSPDHKSGDK